MAHGDAANSIDTHRCVGDCIEGSVGGRIEGRREEGVAASWQPHRAGPVAPALSWRPRRGTAMSRRPRRGRLVLAPRRAGPLVPAPSCRHRRGGIFVVTPSCRPRRSRFIVLASSCRHVIVPERRRAGSSSCRHHRGRLDEAASSWRHRRASLVVVWGAGNPSAPSRQLAISALVVSALMGGALIVWGAAPRWCPHRRRPGRRRP